jgi:hypothetical protein
MAGLVRFRPELPAPAQGRKNYVSKGDKGKTGPAQRVLNATPVPTSPQFRILPGAQMFVQVRAHFWGLPRGSASPLHPSVWRSLVDSLSES